MPSSATGTSDELLCSSWCRTLFRSAVRLGSPRYSGLRSGSSDLPRVSECIDTLRCSGEGAGLIVSRGSAISSDCDAVSGPLAQSPGMLWFLS